MVSIPPPPLILSFIASIFRSTIIYQLLSILWNHKHFCFLNRYRIRPIIHLTKMKIRIFEIKRFFHQCITKICWSAITHLSALSVASLFVVVGVGVLRPVPLVGLFLGGKGFHKKTVSKQSQVKL